MTEFRGSHSDVCLSYWTKFNGFYFSDYEWYATTVALPFPITAVLAGRDKNEGNPVYVGRIRNQDELLPAAVIPQKMGAFATANGQSIKATEFEILIGTGLKWCPCGLDRELPRGALKVGRTSDGHPLYVGRVFDFDTVLVGKVDPRLEHLRVSWEDKEESYAEYEVLVEQKNRTRWCAFALGDEIMADAHVAYDDQFGYPIYIGRAFHDLELLPAKVVPHQNVAFVSHDGCEYRKYGVEVLCGGKVHWEPSSMGEVPVGAVVGGLTSNGEVLYIGKGKFGPHTFLGKIEPMRQRLFIHNNENYEIALSSYEILVEENVAN